MTASVEIRKRLSATFSLEVAFTAPAGFTILFGASGSGKSTVLRCLAGLTRPDSGSIRLGERTVFDGVSGVDIPVQHRNVAYVFQQLALFPHLTVEANIAYGLHRLPAEERRKRAHAIAESFRIADIVHRKPDQVSGGERQRTALARALVTDPAALLLDEPLSALDHAIQSQIMNDLRRWNEQRRIPVLYVTHSHREAFALGERVIVLDQGRVLATGSPHEVLDQPADRMLATLAGFENVFDAVVVERRDRAGTMQCRLRDSAVELEVPLMQGQVGDPIRVAVRAGDILVANQEPRGLSARNVIRGRLIDLTAQGPTMVATVDAGSGAATAARFVVHLTPGGVDSLGLARGSDLWLVVKTYSCRTFV
jgi:molybdate transport system ATP-binding protein